MPWRFEDNEMSATDDSKESDSEDEDSTTYISAHQRRYLAVGELFGQQSGVLGWIQSFGALFTFSSDCSGADTPWMGLSMLWKAAGFPDHLSYMSSSEWESPKRAFLAANFPGCRQLGKDIFTKKVKWMANKVCLYVTGFPCAPYSLLHRSSKLLGDPQAQQLFKVIANIKTMKPAVTVLENVLGVLRVYDEVTEFILKNLPESYFGAPLSRRRLYILLVRRDVLRPGIDAENLQNHIHDLMKSMKIDPSDSYSWQDLLLPDDHPKMVNQGAKWVKRDRIWANEQKVSIRAFFWESFGRSTPLQQSLSQQPARCRHWIWLTWSRRTSLLSTPVRTWGTCPC